MQPGALQVTGLGKETRVDEGTGDGVGWGEAESQEGHLGYLCYGYILFIFFLRSVRVDMTQWPDCA